jgi:hypothetical protein
MGESPLRQSKQPRRAEPWSEAVVTTDVSCTTRCRRHHAGERERIRRMICGQEGSDEPAVATVVRSIRTPAASPAHVFGEIVRSLPPTPRCNCCYRSQDDSLSQHLLVVIAVSLGAGTARPCVTPVNADQRFSPRHRAVTGHGRRRRAPCRKAGGRTFAAQDGRVVEVDHPTRAKYLTGAIRSRCQTARPT